MIIGSIVGYEAAMGVATAVTAIGTMIEAHRYGSGDHFPVQGIVADGSAFEDPINDPGAEYPSGAVSNIPNIPEIIQQNPEMSQNPGLTYDDDEEGDAGDVSVANNGYDTGDEIESYVNNWRETIVIDEPDAEDRPSDQDSPSEQRQSDQRQSDQRPSDYRPGGEPGAEPEPGADSGSFLPQYKPDISPDNIDYNPQKDGKIDTRKIDKNIQEEGLVTKAKGSRKTMKVFKLDRHNIMAQTLTEKTPLVSKFGVNTRSLK